VSKGKNDKIKLKICQVDKIWFRNLFIFRKTMKKPSGVLGVSRKIVPVDIHRCLRDLLWELAHAILEAKQSHDMLSVSWRTREPVLFNLRLRTEGQG
jgi:hypothetical protein